MLDLESTIKHCEEMAEKNEEMCRVEELMGLGLQNTEMVKCARTHKQLAEWLTELKRLREQTRWIPCSERLPERDESVLAYHRDVSFDYQYVSWIDDYSGKWAGFCGSLSDEVLAWMPLPEGYKEKKRE